MPTVFELHEIDSRLVRAINQEARSDPASPYAGKFVAIANGKVVAVGDRLEDVVAAFKQMVPERTQGVIFEANADYEGSHEIWTEWL
jgi:hypothetical protein